MCTFEPMSGKRIVFSTPTPNDQGLIIPSDSIDFARYNVNPVLLCQHDWNAPPLGVMKDIKLEGGKWTGIPIFHRKTAASNEYADLWEAGQLVACSIGGEADWKCNHAGQAILTTDGHRTCERFNLYEISMVTLPSNPDAVQVGLSAKCYEKTELGKITDAIVTLSSQYKTLPTMEVKKTPEELALEAAQAEVTRLQAEVEKKKKLGSTTDPSLDQLPGVLKEIINSNAALHRENTTFMSGLLDKLFGFFGTQPKKAKNAAPAPGKPTETSEISEGDEEQPEPTGLSAEVTAAKLKAETAQANAAKALKNASLAKGKAEKAGATQEDKDAYQTSLTAAQTAMTTALEADDEYKACMNEAEEPDGDEGEDGEDGAAKPKKKASKNAAGGDGSKKTTLAAGTTGAAKPAVTMKTPEELAAEGKTLAPKPEIRAKINAAGRVKFSAIMDPKNVEGQKILNRVLDPQENKDIADYAIILESIMTDKKFAAIVDKTRVIANISEAQFNGFSRSGDLNARPGLSLAHFAAQLQAGYVDVMGGDNQMKRVTTLGSNREITKLTSTDNALAAPALNTIEWLSLAIFTLFPTTDWKNDIPMFGAQMTSQNTGIIWANIAADPTITFGNQPVNPADYAYTDDAVALTLIPSWLQPMLWTPLTMHQLRYDQMATGWAQAFAKWGSLIDDKLIFTLASTVPAGSIIQTIGQTSPNGPGSQFTLTGANDPNAFFYNPDLQATLATPAYSDIIRTEQLYNKQNYQLTREKPRLVIDPTMERYLCEDPFTQSLLTRWIEANKEDLLKLKHTTLNQRSRVAIYDPASGQVKDPSGVIPATAVSAAIGFLASQVALGLGILDVFMIQDPSAYGYRMSADIREGVVPVRKSFNGTLLYTYGAPVVA